ncbi:hypothetical protein [Rhizobium sophoriradicis]|uniref:hypothetical protein n=1 Tax=Rhizobium sophoriradicis TaxID=1535245 RepID=UPI001FDEA3C2|nr:hypothetical protein [Rhizobium sophoriradicis]
MIDVCSMGMVLCGGYLLAASAGGLGGAENVLSDSPLSAADVSSFETFIVRSPPTSLNLDPFYAKYADAAGIPIISSNKVPDTALLISRDIVLYMLSERRDVRDALIHTAEAISPLPHQKISRLTIQASIISWPKSTAMTTTFWRMSITGIRRSRSNVPLVLTAGLMLQSRWRPELSLSQVRIEPKSRALGPILIDVVLHIGTRPEAFLVGVQIGTFNSCNEIRIYRAQRVENIM